MRGQFADLGLGEARALRRQVDDAGLGGVGFAGGLEGVAQRIDQHHHARTTAEHAFIDASIRIGGVIARIPCMQCQQSALLCPSDHTDSGSGLDELGKQRDDVHPHFKTPDPNPP